MPFVNSEKWLIYLISIEKARAKMRGLRTEAIQGIAREKGTGTLLHVLAEV
jgi:hypothetical protein